MYSTPPNAFLRALSTDTLQRLSREMVLVDLERGVEIGVEGEAIAFIYFPLDALLSASRCTLDGFAVETRLVGCEGAANVAQTMGSGRFSSHLQAQIGGQALRISTQAFRQAAATSTSFGEAIWRGVEFQLWETEQSCLCLAAHPVEARLARWLLEAEERSARRGGELGITHEFMGIMLGAQRTTVTRVLGELSRRGLVATRRGSVRVTDAEGLGEVACECRAQSVAERGRLGLQPCHA